MATLHSVRINDRRHVTGDSGEASMGKDSGAISGQLLDERREHSRAFQCPVSDPSLTADR
jgi:hypothetical protein